MSTRGGRSVFIMSPNIGNILVIASPRSESVGLIFSIASLVVSNAPVKGLNAASFDISDVSKSAAGEPPPELPESHTLISSSPEKFF